jgi:hypothetical protein
VLHTLDYRHTAVGIGRVKVGESFGKSYQDELGEVEEAEVEDDGEDVLELQNSRTTAMGVGNYSVPNDIVKHLSVRSIDAFRPLSMAWHRFLGVDGRSETRQVAVVSRVHGARKRVLEESTSGSAATLPQEKQVRVEDPRRDGICKALQQVLGQQDVGFRSVEQEKAMHAVLDGQNPLVVVFPTAGDNSLLFTVPAVVEQSEVTVVVVPYRALIDNLMGRITKSGIECIEWKHGEDNPASVVEVSADLAGNITSNGNFVAYVWYGMVLIFVHKMGIKSTIIASRRAYRTR